MPDQGSESRRPPKPKAPPRGRGAARPPETGGEPPTATGRVTTAELAARVENLSAAVARIEDALAPRSRSADVSAEEHALLNLLDSIVDRRTEAVLLPVARLAVLVDRAATARDEDERARLLGQSAEDLGRVLEALGLEPVAPARGEAFSPLLHEEVRQDAAPDLEDGQVSELVRAGCRVRSGPVLVPALVAVAVRSPP